MDDERVAQYERELWQGGGDVYRQRIADDCLMVVPAEPFLLTGSEAVGAVEHTPRWADVAFSELKISRPQEGLIVLAYKVEASKAEASGDSDDERYVAWCSSTLRRRGHEDWEVIQHQQTVAPTA